jgi:hypothetical protein
MQQINLWLLHRQFEEANIQICFNGPLTHSIIEELGMAVRRYLENETPGTEKNDGYFFGLHRTDTKRT